MAGYIDFTVLSILSINMPASFVVSSEPNTPNPALITYSWSAPDFSPVTQEGKTFTAAASEIAGTYPVTLTAQSEGYCDLAITKDVVVQNCMLPGTTGITFAEFNPCAGAPYGSTYTLTDDRDQKTYKVKYMPDGRYWMVQDLMFGTCTASSFKNDNSEAATKVEPTVAPGYVGHCRNSSVTGAGYFYNWPAIMNNSMAYYGSSDKSFACSGIGPQNNACKGICPTGWHVPTGMDAGEYYALHTAMSEYWSCSGDDCWSTTSHWATALGGWCESSGYQVWKDWSAYASSTINAGGYVSLEGSYWAGSHPNYYPDHKNEGLYTRCVRNY
jgi:uncharacterized protein (TIGR02145 family)